MNDSRKKQYELLQLVHREAKRLADEDVKLLAGLSPEARRRIHDRKVRQWTTSILRNKGGRYDEWHANREVARLRDDFRRENF